MKCCALAAFAGLSACGGSANTTNSLTVTPSTVWSGAGSLNVSRDASTGVVTLIPPGASAPTVLTPNSNVDVESFEGLFNSADQDLYLRKSTDGAAVAVYSSATRANSFSGTIITRQADTAIPVSGSATFAGDYVGLEVYPALDSLGFATIGRAEITADFEAQTIEGRITDRLSARTDGPLSDILFEPSELLGDGNAVGAATGGIGKGNFGSYSVLITGPNAETVSGQVKMTYADVQVSSTSTIDIEEYGVFIAQ